jgi:hypothetical protein
MGFNKYSAGNKVYGMARSAPTVGPVDKAGYRERDAKHRVRRNAVLRRMKKEMSGNLMHPDARRWQ